MPLVWVRRVVPKGVVHLLAALGQRQVEVTLLVGHLLSVELLPLVDHPLQVEARPSVGHRREAAVQLLAGHRPRAEVSLAAGQIWVLRSRRYQPAWESCLSLP